MNENDDTYISKKYSIKIPLRIEDGSLFYDKSFFQFGDLSISLDIQLTDFKHIVKYIFTAGSKTHFPVKALIIIQDKSQILLGKSIINKEITFLEKHPSQFIYSGLKSEYVRKLTIFEKNNIPQLDLIIEIKVQNSKQPKPPESNGISPENSFNRFKTMGNISKYYQTKIILANEKVSSSEKNEINAKFDKTYKLDIIDESNSSEKVNILDKNEKTNKFQKTEKIDKQKKSNEDGQIFKLEELNESDISEKTNKNDKISKNENPNSKKAENEKQPNKAIQNNINIINNNVKNESKNNNAKNTKYNGIYNQGATCYINSSVQTLFFIPYFRNVIFNVTCQEGTLESELQHLFYNLKCGKTHCSTKKLTKSFGMSDSSVHVQQDIQEFLSGFLDKLEEDLKKDQKLKDKISYIFEGKTVNFIKSSSSKILNSSTDTFKQLMINVSKSVDSSLKSFFGSEIIDNYIINNEYQTVTLETKLLSLPRILQIVIKRYKRGSLTNSNEKDNSKVEFSENLDLNPYVEKNDNYFQKCTKYKLFAVIVHSGSISQGHYSVYLRPEMKDDWFYFSDTTAKKSSSYEAIEMNFGGTNHSNYNLNDNYTSLENSKSAYVLVYVRIDSIEEMFTHDSYILPEKYMNFVENENQVTKSDTSFLIDFQVFNEFCLIDNCKKGIATFYNDNYSLNISVDLKSEAEDIYENISLMTKIESCRLRLWTISNDGKYLDRIISPMDQIESLDVQKLFLEIKNEEEFILCNKTKVYFLLLYTRINSKPLLYLQTIHYDSNTYLKYQIIINDGIKIIKFYTNSNINDASVYVYNYNTVTKKLPIENCNEKNGSMLILQISEELNDSLIENIEKNILIDKRLNSIKNFKRKKQQKNSIVYNYYDFMTTNIPNSYEYFIESLNNIKRVNIYSFDDITKRVGVIDVPLTVQYNELVLFIQFVFDVNESFNDQEELFLLFAREKDSDVPKKLPIRNKGCPFSDDKTIDVIYYSIVSKKFALDPTSKTRVVQLSKDGFSIGKVVCYFWPESAIHPFLQFVLYNESFFNEKNKLENRMLIVNKDKEICQLITDNDDKFTFDNNKMLRIEKVEIDQIGSELIILQTASVGKHDKIQNLGNPFYLSFIDNESISDFHRRIVSFLGFDIGPFKVHPKANYFHKCDVIKQKIHFEEWHNTRVLYLICDNENII